MHEIIGVLVIAVLFAVFAGFQMADGKGCHGCSSGGGGDCSSCSVGGDNNEFQGRTP